MKMNHPQIHLQSEHHSSPHTKNQAATAASRICFQLEILRIKQAGKIP